MCIHVKIHNASIYVALRSHLNAHTNIIVICLVAATGDHGLFIGCMFRNLFYIRPTCIFNRILNMQELP